jgi:ABC-2 type transport system ATP-binding protein
MIQLEGLRKEYDDVVAVDALSLTVAEGEIFGLIGPNGAGKTTTMRIAAGLLPPTQGRVVVAGVDVEREPERAQQFIGYLADFFSVYEGLRVWEYLDFFAGAYQLPASESAARIRQTLAEVGLEDEAETLIHGLSRGMTQRLGIARAVIHRPRLLILDEPAAGLDPAARVDLRNLLLHFREEGSTILISSQVLSELEGLCTSIGIMERGRLIQSGAVREMTAGERDSRAVRLSWLGDGGARLESRLRADGRVSRLVLHGSEGGFQFAGGEDDLAGLLAELVASGVRVVSFTETRQTIEDLYLEITGRRGRS